MATSTIPTAVTFASTTLDVSTSITAPPIVLATPYSFPRECDTVSWNITVGERPVSGQYGAYYFETFLYLPQNNDEWRTANSEYYQKCHRPATATLPYKIGPGEQAPSTISSAVYRAAVCPKDWKAFEVGMASWRESTWSTALCCKSGHTLTTDIWSLSYDISIGATTNKACAQTLTPAKDHIFGAPLITKLEFTTHGKLNETVVTSTSTYLAEYQETTLPDGQMTLIPGATRTAKYTMIDYDWSTLTSTVYWRGGRAFYPAWSMEWVVEDNASLNPPWPTLTSDMLIPTWAPGMSLYEGGYYDNKGEGPSGNRAPETKLGKIGRPVVGALSGFIGLLLILGGAFWCFRRRARKNEIKRRSFMHELEIREGGDGTERRGSGSLTVDPPE